MAAAELVRGQNRPLPGTRLTVHVAPGGPAATAVLLADADGRLTAGPGALARHGLPEPGGVRLPSEREVAVDLAALPAGVQRLFVALVLPAGAPSFASGAAPSVALATEGGEPVAGFTLTGLGVETAVVAVELYLRGDAWKVRAIGQGYAGGAAELLRDHGAPDPDALAVTLTHPATPSTGGGTAPAGSSATAPGTVPATAPGTTPATAGGTGINTVHPGREAAASQAVPAHGTPQDAVPSGRAITADQATSASGGGINTVHPGRAAASSQDTPAQGTPAGAGAGAASGTPVDTSHPGRASVPPPPAYPPTVQPSAAGADPSVPPPVAGDAAGWTMDERLYNQVWGMFEDAARSAAAYRSAVSYADQRLDQEIEALLADPRARFGPDAELARFQARARRDDLESRAREVLERDAAQLLAETAVVEEAMPAPMARWSSPVWAAWQPPAEPPFAVRLGELHLPENAALRVPMLVRYPLQRGLWVDTGSAQEFSGAESALLGAADRKVAAVAVAQAVAARLLACHRPGGLLLHAIVPGGTDGGLVAPFARAGLLSGPPATDAALVGMLLESLVERVDLVQMARRAGVGSAASALPPHVDPADRLLLVHDFPYGFDDRTVARLRYLAEEGPEAGVHLLVVADRAEAREYGPLLDSFWRGLTRLAPVEQDYLADPWVEHLWTYSPEAPSPGSPVLPGLLDRIARGR